MSEVIRNRNSRSIQIFFWICFSIALAVVARRTWSYMGTQTQPGPPMMISVEAAFQSRKALTLAHILPAAVLVLLSPLILSRGVGKRRLLDLVFYMLGSWTGLTAYAMSGHPVGGSVERAAVLVFNTWFLVALIRSLVEWSKGSYANADRYLFRAVGVLLGIATTRPVMGVFFATSRLTGWTPQQFFGYAFWIGFAINTLVAELWLKRRRYDS